jgi:hypothetical protein
MDPVRLGLAVLLAALGPPAARAQTAAEVPSAVVVVHVVDREGRPAEGAFVFLEEEGTEGRLLSADALGTVTAPVDPGTSHRVRAAATSGDAWGMTAWQAPPEGPAGLTVGLLSAGTLAIESAGLEGALHLETRGWDLAALLARLGAGPAIYPGTPLLIPGLPEGDYSVVLGEQRRPVTVRAGATVRVAFE